MIDRSKYKMIEIPEELDSVIRGAIDEGIHGRGQGSALRKAATFAAALVFCFVSLLNLSPVFAKAVYNLPVFGELCRVLTFREYHFEDEIKYIDVEIPEIANTGKTELEKRVNLEIRKIAADYLRDSEARAKEYYEAFVETGGNPEDFVPVGITIDYEIKSVSPNYASFVLSEYETKFGAYTSHVYYNIDLESGRVLTLKDWFGNDYRRIVADSISNTIAGWDDRQRELLWDDLSVIDLINENTDFYLNESGEIVVVFEKYEAACGSAGALEFVIRDAA